MLSTKPYANIQIGIGSSVAACQKIKIIPSKWIHFGLSSGKKHPIQQLQPIQHNSKISIDIFLLSIPPSTTVISPKKSQDQQTKTWETIQKKIRKVNKIAFTEGGLYALPLSTSSYWTKQTFMGEELSTSSPVTFLLQLDSRSCLRHRHMSKEYKQSSHPLKIKLYVHKPLRYLLTCSLVYFFFPLTIFQTFRKLASSTQKPGVLIPCFKKVIICIFIALFNKSNPSQLMRPCYEFANYCSLNSSCRDSGLLFYCWCIVWSVVQ